jgi:hypothetical protein
MALPQRYRPSRLIEVVPSSAPWKANDTAQGLAGAFGKLPGVTRWALRVAKEWLGKTGASILRVSLQRLSATVYCAWGANEPSLV